MEKDKSYIEEKEEELNNKLEEIEEQNNNLFELKKTEYKNKYSKMSREKLIKELKKEERLNSINESIASRAEIRAGEWNPAKSIASGVLALVGAAFLAGGAFLLTKHPVLIQELEAETGFIPDLFANVDKKTFCDAFGGTWLGLGTVLAADSSILSQKVNMSVYKKAKKAEIKHGKKADVIKDLLLYEKRPKIEFFDFNDDLSK